MTIEDKESGFTLRKSTLGLLGVCILSTVSLGVQAANWTMLQGTEPDAAVGRAKVWGFIDTMYQKDTSEANKDAGLPGNNYSYVPAELIGPDLNAQQGFNVTRARVGVRGEGFPLDGKVNYFVLAEFGNNAVTHGDGSSTKLTDASITLNEIPYARIRVGAFKVPTFEEGYQAIHVFDYVNFTEVANQMMLERYPNNQATLNRNNVAGFAYTDDNNTSPYNRFDKPVGAFRDVGIQLFDSISIGSWDSTYALMVGNGNGVNFADNDNNKDTYVYLSTEKVFAGKGPFRQGLKFFVWAQSGKRTLYNGAFAAGEPTKAFNDTEPSGKTEYDRKRSGLGFKLLKGPFRVTAEYLKGEGMIFLGPDNPTFTITSPIITAGPLAVAHSNEVALLADGRKGKANGWYVDGGWKLGSSNFELDARYDVYNRLTDAEKIAPAGPCSFDFTFKTITLGAQYHINKKTRVTFNVASRNFDAGSCPVAYSTTQTPNNNIDGVDKRYGLLLRHIF